MATARTEEEWLDRIRTLMLRGETGPAQAVLNQALAEYPASIELRRAQAGVFQQSGQAVAAETAFRELLTRNPGDASSAFALAALLKEQGRTAGAAAVLRACLAAESNRRNPELAIRAIELLDDLDRKRDAAAIAEAAITEHPNDPRLHAYAGMLAIQLGEFGRAREHYVFALEHDEQAWEWHVPIGLSAAQRYDSATHPDFARFNDGIHRPGLSEAARAELHFALGKACDDVGNYAEAAQNFRAGNAIRKRHTPWSRKAWRRTIEARMASPSNWPHVGPTPNPTPIFVVGMPRSGTTLMAERLGCLPDVINRGEQPWLARLALQPELSGHPILDELERAAAIYVGRVLQDDADAARWFIDKQPLNFRYIDLALALFPDARVVHCQRSPRDNALSLWTQCFLEDVQGYSYDFRDIARVMRDCERLMAHWRARYPDSIRTVRYEDFVTAPAHVVAGLAAWIGVPDSGSDTISSAHSAESVISTASLWQARQPVNTRSIGRWQRYAQHVPELLDFPEA